MPEVSVIMPVYNGEKFLAEAIESVLNQNFKDFELICVNDGSTDQSKQIIMSFRDDRIRYIERENSSGGPALPRNIGIELSKSRYVSFIDQDDIYLETSLYDRISFFSAHRNEEFVYSNCSLIYDNVDLKSNAPNESLTLYNKDVCIGKCFKQLFLYGCIVPIQTAMIKRDVFVKVGVFNDTLIGTDDYNMWLRIAYFYKLNYIDKCVSKWRIHKKSLSRRALMMEKNTALCLESVLNEFPGAEKVIGQASLRHRMYQVCFDVAYLAFTAGDVETARYWLKNAWHWGRKPKTLLLLAAMVCCGSLVGKFYGRKAAA